MSSGLERTDAYLMRGWIHRFLSKTRNRSTKWGLLMLCIPSFFLLT